MKRLASLAILCLAAGCSSENGPNPVQTAPPDASVPDASAPDSSAPDASGPLPAMVPTATGKDGAAATVDIRATAAAIDVLRSGGNAIDAAVASAAVLGVTDPFSCGIGGGGFMVIYVASEGQVVTIDHRETMPQAFSSALFYENGAPIPFAELVTSGLSAGVPGTIRGWDEALRRYGTRSLSDVLDPGIRVAEDGFDVDFTFSDQITRNLERFKAITSTAALFLTKDAAAPAIGDTFKNPELAAAYRLLREAGLPAFYGGEIGKAVVAAVTSPPVAPGASLKVRPGVMKLSDLASYEVRVRPPVESNYRGFTLYGLDLPSSGGLTVAMTLNLLSGFQAGALSKTEVLHRYLESTRRTFADRNAYMGDPEFVDAPVSGLLSLDYADERRAGIDLTKASTAAVPPGNPFVFDDDPSTLGPTPKAKLGWPEPGAIFDKETTHISVTDSAGNIVSYTCTIESEGGNGIVVPGYGFLLNNELTDFNIPADPAAKHPNVAEPGKRPRSSMSPVIVFKDGKPYLTVGSPGGSSIITTVLQILVNHIDLGMPIDASIAAPRASQRNAADATSAAEPDFIKSPEAAELGALGHLFSDAGLIGAATAIRFNEDGTLTAAAEPARRGGGSALVVTPSP